MRKTNEREIEKKEKEEREEKTSEHE